MLQQLHEHHGGLGRFGNAASGLVARGRLIALHHISLLPGVGQSQSHKNVETAQVPNTDPNRGKPYADPVPDGQCKYEFTNQYVSVCWFKCNCAGVDMTAP